MRYKLNAALWTAGIALLGSVFHGSDATAYKVYADVPNVYSTGTCFPTIGDRSDTTGMIQDQLAGVGWTKLHFEGSAAWPTDFIDCTKSNGDDCNQTDTADLAIFRGHAQTNQLAFSHPRGGTCQASPGIDVELGRYGAAPKTAMLITGSCCVMNLHQPQNFTETGGLNQQLGFGNLSTEETTMVNNFWWHAGNGGNNISAWLSQMEDKPGWFTGDNTPVGFTRGSTSTSAANNRNVCSLPSQTCWGRIGYTVGSAWQYDYYDHGCGGCNGC